MYVKRHELTVNTSTGGAATVYTPLVNARVLSVHYTLATSTPLASGGTLSVITDQTGETVISQALGAASFTKTPRKLTDTATGGSGPAGAVAFFYAGDERVRVTVTGGGSSTTGTVTVLTG